MRITFLAEDGSAQQAALLCAHSLRTDGKAPLPICSATEQATEALARAHQDGQDIVLALPLDCLADEAVRVLSSLTVVVANPGMPSTKRALQIARDADAALPHAPPAWVLPRSGAMLGQVATRTRTLPTRLPCFPDAQAARLSARELPPDLMGVAAQVGAAVMLALSDPFAPALGRSRLHEIFSGLTSSDLDLKQRLIQLAGFLREPERAPLRRRTEPRRTAGWRQFGTTPADYAGRAVARAAR